jgi:3-oxoacyl-[acyl-carrier-protein] synthase-1/3-oxoacyl-[acyl-carrier-protein] synthase II
VRRVIAVGTDAMINRLSLANFCALGVLSRRNDSPEAACRPFDARRQGFVIGEGAGALVLERIDEGPSPPHTLGYLAGYGVSADAFSITDKESDGSGVALSIEQALATSGAGADEVVYINAHGPGTRQNDPGEAAAIRRVFAAGAPRIPISSIKGQIGHTIAAAGAIESIVTLLSLTERRAPGTANLETVGEEMADLNILRPGVHPIGEGLGLSISAGFGGVNVSLLIAGPEGR